MPKKDGREALAEIKSDPKLRHIPVVVLTTSRAEEDVFRTYDLGVNSFITKPVTFAGLVEVVQGLVSLLVRARRPTDRAIWPWCLTSSQSCWWRMTRTTS